MEYAGKTKEQLISELMELRQRITELETIENQHKRAEEALRESEERLQAFLESAPDSFSLYDSELNLLEINEAGLSWFLPGTKKEDLVGKNMLEIAPYIKETGRYEKYREVIKTGKPFFVDDIVSHPRFGARHLNVRAFKVGEGLGLIATDITERKQAEEALRESEERYRRLVELSPDPIAVYSQGKIVFVNRAGVELIGATCADELIGKPVIDFVHPNYREIILERLQEMRESGKPAPVIEEKVIRLDGRAIDVEVTSVPIAYEDKPAALTIAHDITERKRAEEALKNAAVETVEALSRVVEANDPYTAGHSTIVTEMAIKIAQEMGLRDEERDTLRIAAPLHDVGKVGISNSVLNKPARLTQAEWVMIQAHPVASAQMAERVTAFKEAVPIIRHHHERWDGTGYPDGLKGEEIPLLARILAVADGFEAMTSERPYRWARTEEEALAELKKGAGSQWDPKVVEVFVKMYEGGIIS